jgi:SAM-dependent methyltransferase
MDDASVQKLRIWHGPESGQALDPVDVSRGGPQAESFANRLYRQESLAQAKRSRRPSLAVEPFSLEWFLRIEHDRHVRHGSWLPKLLEFTKHSGETLLALGDGLGTDWLQFARHGAQVIVASSSAEQLAMVRRHFDLRGMKARFVHASASSLPLESGSIDVVCLSGWTGDVHEPSRTTSEIHRVLKAGGKVICVVPARFDVSYWDAACFPWKYWGRKQNNPPAIRFSARDLRLLFHRFVAHRIRKRHLRRVDVPHLWRWMPIAVLERLIGRTLILKAFKPVIASLPVRVAA